MVFFAVASAQEEGKKHMWVQGVPLVNCSPFKDYLLRQIYETPEKEAVPIYGKKKKEEKKEGRKETLFVREGIRAQKKENREVG